ncbi:hypothetical protein EVAR_13425_1 [Eumeta japonica]|uniref:Uncharacterized protein n=1 Tax=Eumeta variegata TaxID=151549 RepID=A0A4C1V766_EUMVA|nr:hypothetical protein EVAR_13425_1 [Eumeta japonica]
MPRVRVKKTFRGQSNLSRYKNTFEEVEAEDSLRKAADKRGTNHCSLLRYLRKRHASSQSQRTDSDESLFIAPVVNNGITKTAQNMVLAMFATFETRIDPCAKYLFY